VSELKTKTAVDFTNCKIVNSRAYNGANGSKIAVVYNDEIYMLKFPPVPGTKHPAELSYINSCISEYIGCQIYDSIGFDVQQTILGTYSINGKEKIVCACRDFTNDDNVFFDFCSIKNTVIDSGHKGTGTELSEILEAIELQDRVDSKKLMDFYFDMFVVDTLLGNFDRHNGNFGFLYNKKTDEFEIAPVYDCGSCLFPRLSEKGMAEVLNVDGEINSRVYNFPLSMIKIDDKKINYFNFVISLESENCNQAVKRIVPKIDINRIFEIINTTPFISDVQKDFYRTILKARCDIILLPTLNRLKEAELENQDKPKMSLEKRFVVKKEQMSQVNANREKSEKSIKPTKDEL
jgi:hypothetical protein